MKNLIKFYIPLFFGLFVMFLNTKAQHNPIKEESSTYLYRDLGSSSFKLNDGSTISIEAYILKGKNTNGFYGQYANQFILVAKSKSIYASRYTETWLYGVKVFLDGYELTHGQYPQGYTAYIKTSPTIIYTWYTNSNDIGDYGFIWTSSQYDVK